MKKMNPSKSFYCLILITFLFVFQVNATDWYVDNAATGANNGASWTDAWQSFAAINWGSLQPNDTVFVKEGIYNEIFTIDGLSSTRDNPITIQPFEDDAVVIEGAGTHTGRINILNCNYLTFKGFEIRNMNQGLQIHNSTHINIENCDLHNFGQEGITIRDNSHYCTIENNKIHDTAQDPNHPEWAQWSEGIYIGSSSSFAYDEVTNINIKNNEVYNVTPEGIELKPGTRDCVVEGNIFYDIYNNYNNQPIVTIGAIEIDQDVHNRTPDNSYSSNPNHIIKENIIHDTYTGIRTGSGCKIYNNIIYSTTYHGIYADNVNRDDYLRQIYHNTINLPSSYSITVNGATTDIRNNIGSSETGNLATDNSYFVNTQSGHEDFHLIVNTAPIDAGENVGITQDFEGNIRPQGVAPDMGAYEYTTGTNINNESSEKMRLQRIYPNPFSYTTTIEYTLPKSSDVEITLSDVTGRKIENLYSGYQSSGVHTLDINVNDLNPGIYFYRIRTELYDLSSKCMISK